MKNKLYWIGIILILSTIFLIAINDGNLGKQVNQKLLEAKDYISPYTSPDKTTYIIGENIIFNTRILNSLSSGSYYWKSKISFNTYEKEDFIGWLNPGDTHTDIYTIPTTGMSAGTYTLYARSYYGTNTAAIEDIIFSNYNENDINALITSYDGIPAIISITLVAPTPDPIVTITTVPTGASVIMDGVTKTSPNTWQLAPSQTYSAEVSASGYITRTVDVPVTTSDKTQNIILETVPIPPTLTFNANFEGVTITDFDTPSNTGITDAQGNLVFSNLGEGTFTFTASKTGYYSDQTSYVISLSNNNDVIEPIVMTLNKVDVTITTNIPSVDISDGYTSKQTNSIEPYSVTFTDYVANNPQAFQYTASKIGYDITYKTINIGTNDISTTINLQETIITPDAYNLTFTINNENNEPLENVRVFASGQEVFTNTLGIATITDCIGNIDYSFTKNGYYTETGSINVISDGQVFEFSMNVITTTTTNPSTDGGSGSAVTSTINSDGVEEFAVTNTNPTLILDGKDDKTSPIIIFSGIIILIAGLIFIRSKIN